VDTHQNFDVPTARRRVRATSLRSPLQLSTDVVQFKLPAAYFDLKIENMSGRIKVTIWCFVILQKFILYCVIGNSGLQNHF